MAWKSSWQPSWATGNTAKEVTTADLLRQIRKSEAKAKVSPRKPRKSILTRIMDWMSRDIYAVAGAAKAVQTGQSPGKAFMAGLKGKPGSFEDVLATAGVKKGLGRTAAGLGLDIFASPLTWVGTGLALAEPSPVGEAALITSKLARIGKTLSKVQPATGVVKKGVEIAPDVIKAARAAGAVPVRGVPGLTRGVIGTKKITEPVRKAWKGLKGVTAATEKAIAKGKLEDVGKMLKPVLEAQLKIVPPYPLSIWIPGQPFIRSQKLGTALSNISKKMKALPVIKEFGGTFIPMFDVPLDMKIAYRGATGEIRYASHFLEKRLQEISGATKGQVLNPLERRLIGVVMEGGEDSLKEAVKLFPDYKKYSYTSSKVINAAQEMRKDFTRVLATEKKLGLTIDEIDEYFPKMYRDVIRTYITPPSPGLPGFTKKRLLGGWLDAIKGGRELETDALKVYYLRMAGHYQLVNRAKFVRDVMDNYGVPMKIAKPIGFKAFRSPVYKLPVINKKGIVTGYKQAQQWLPEEIARAVSKVERFYNRDEDAAAFLNMFDKALNAWKGFATAVNPGFHGRNFYSDMFMWYLDDISPKWLKPALSVVRGKTPFGKLNGYTYEELIKQGSRLGVPSGGFLAQEFPEQIGKMIAGRSKYAGARLPFSIRETGRAFGMQREDVARWGHYFGEVAKGKSPQEAVQSVIKYHFDYNELTQAERTVMKRIVPFYTWMRKNIPLQLSQVVEKPGRYAQLARMKSAMERAAPGLTPEQTEFLPDWIQELWGIRVPTKVAEIMLKPTDTLAQLFGAKSVKKGTPYFFNPNLAFQDINRGFDFWDLMSTLNPLIKTPLEIATNRVFFFRGRPMEAYPGASVRALPGANLLPSKIKKIFNIRKIEGEWKMPLVYRKVLQDANPWLANIGRTLDTGNDNWATNLLSFFIGIKFIPYHERYTKGEMFQRRSELVQHIRKLKAEGVIKEK